MEDTQLVATNPHQMAQAQHSMVEFCEHKLPACKASWRRPTASSRRCARPT
jgi:hypothetical protein